MSNWKKVVVNTIRNRKKRKLDDISNLDQENILVNNNKKELINTEQIAQEKNENENENENQIEDENENENEIEDNDNKNEPDNENEIEDNDNKNEPDNDDNEVELLIKSEESFEYRANKQLVVELKQLNVEYTRLNSKLKSDFNNLEKSNSELTLTNASLKDKLQLFYICMVVITILQTLLVYCFALR